MHREKMLPLPEHPAYHLSDEGHLMLEEIRDQLLFLSTLAHSQTESEGSTMLQVTRDALGESYGHFARQLMDVLDHEVKHLRAAAPPGKKAH
jgi:hypothetical protein